MNRATDVALDSVEGRRASSVHVVETSAAGWPDRKLVAAAAVVAAAGEGEEVLRLYLVSVPAVALSDLLADTAGSKPKVAVVEA